MECELPDFPRGTVVKMSIAINGVEFFACPGELVVFQSPRITELVPSWISMAPTIGLKLRGINFTTQSPAHTAVQVSFKRGSVQRMLQGTCVDGEVLCAIPHELLERDASTSARARSEAVATSPTESTLAGPESPSRTTKSRATDYASNPLVLTPPILVDVWLGGVHKAVRLSCIQLLVCLRDGWIGGRSLSLSLLSSLTPSVLAPMVIVHWHASATSRLRARAVDARACADERSDLRRLCDRH